jgi:hypothetical protein
MKKTSKFLLLITAAVLLPSVSWANIMFTLGNNPQPGEENVLLNQGETGQTVTGSTQQSHIGVTFFSGSQTLTIPANGQARIEATSGGSQVALNDIRFALTSGGTFTDAIFDMHIGGTIGTSGDTVTIQAQDNLDIFHSFAFPLGNGQNFLTVVASNGESIQNIAIFLPVGGFTDLRQVRISGAGGVSVPDSGTTLTLLGASMLALALLRPAARAKFRKA